MKTETFFSNSIDAGKKKKKKEKHITVIVGRSSIPTEVTFPGQIRREKEKKERGETFEKVLYQDANTGGKPVKLAVEGKKKGGGTVAPLKKGRKGVFLYQSTEREEKGTKKPSRSLTTGETSSVASPLRKRKKRGGTQMRKRNPSFNQKIKERYLRSPKKGGGAMCIFFRGRKESEGIFLGGCPRTREKGKRSNFYRIKGKKKEGASYHPINLKREKILQSSGRKEGVQPTNASSIKKKKKCLTRREKTKGGAAAPS